MEKQYKFKSRSAFSFAVHHKGRQVYVNFSAAYRGLSFFITKDETLAEKIRQHRWYKQGRITEEVVEIQGPKEQPAYVPTPPEARKKYSILGRTMTGGAPKRQEALINQAAQVVERTIQSQKPVEQKPDETAPQEVQDTFKAEDVSTFMEAKEFFITNFGVARSECSTKEAISVLCSQYNVEFPNYPV